MNEALETQARRLREIAAELEKAAAHAKIAAGHFTAGEVPRACAHSFAVDGHLIAAAELLAEIAKDHRVKARVE